MGVRDKADCDDDSTSSLTCFDILVPGDFPS